MYIEAYIRSMQCRNSHEKTFIYNIYAYRWRKTLFADESARNCDEFATQLVYRYAWKSLLLKKNRFC